MGCRFAVLCVAAAGCNAMYDLDETVLTPSPDGGFGPGTIDQDLDGIPDEMDPCIAAMLDATDDFDRDLLTNDTDPCPFDPADSAGGNPDADADGVNDACDPFPTVAGDGRRCTMRFYNTDLNARLWRESDPLPSWSSVPGMLYAEDDATASTLLSTIDLEQVAEPTFDVAVYTAGDPFSTHAVRIWARGADPSSRDDVGCEVFGDRTYTRIAVALGDGRDVGTPLTLAGTPFPLAASLRVQLTSVPATGNVRCTVSRYPDRWVVSASAVLQPGRFGFGSEGIQTQIQGLAIYDRATVVPLP